MTASGAASSPRSPLGHVILPDWKQELDGPQFARALLQVAAHLAENRATEPAGVSDEKGDTA